MKQTKSQYNSPRVESDNKLLSS